MVGENQYFVVLSDGFFFLMRGNYSGGKEKLQVSSQYCFYLPGKFDRLKYSLKWCFNLPEYIAGQYMP